MSFIVDTFSNRLRYAITIKNIKPIELSRMTGISKTNISCYLSGKYEAKQDGVKILADALNVNPVWLMGYDVPMEQSSTIRPIKSQSIESNVFPVTDMPKKVPVIGKISAGLPILATENILGYEYAPSSMLKEDFEYFYLKVQGDSMNLKFNDGDIVLVQKQDTLEQGDIGVVLINGFDATVKKYKYENGLVILEPMSTNPMHSVQIYNPKEIEIHVVGKVISYQGKV